MLTINQPIQGMGDVFGAQLRRRNFVIRLLSDNATRFGFQQLEVPVVEKASSFDENIVGKSPWPEWDKRGCFYLTVNNYSGTYNNKASTEAALLNPEGTISVTRWLGKIMQEVGPPFPLKLFYDVQCFRNELVDKLSATKHRQFRQFGIEILGTSSIAADTEIACMINDSLLLLGFPQESVVMRISDIRIFTQLIKDSGVSYDDSLVIKELMDAVAESRAGKNPEMAPSYKKELWTMLNSYSLTGKLRTMWTCVLDEPHLHLSETTKNFFGERYHNAFDALSMLTTSLQKCAINAKADLCVVRSHEYYTGLSFEVDVVSDSVSYFEIAGGGRFDKLVSSFLTKTDKDTIVPSTGFAFGVERLIEAALGFGLMSNLKCIESFTHFDDTSADTLLVPSVARNGCDAYISAKRKAQKFSAHRRVNIYVGDNHVVEHLNKYAKTCGATNVEFDE